MLQLSALMCYSVWGASAGLSVAVYYQQYFHPDIHKPHSDEVQ